jgi:hypothetical protein
LGEVLSDGGIPAVGIEDADALPTSERPSPAAPSTFTAAALFVRFGFEACLTRGMVASSVSSCENAWQVCAQRNRRARVTWTNRLHLHHDAIGHNEKRVVIVCYFSKHRIEYQRL